VSTARTAVGGNGAAWRRWVARRRGGNARPFLQFVARNE